jgi:hypothetical protein
MGDPQLRHQAFVKLGIGMFDAIIRRAQPVQSRRTALAG